jgi:hypothetical protein
MVKADVRIIEVCYNVKECIYAVQAAKVFNVIRIPGII